jgi:NDP-sugar pyrophosphorylase family protein
MIKKINTVCILTAGKGTRMGALGQQLNKALHPIDGKAIISHIIENFPVETEFVIGLGYLSLQVRQYLQIAHANRKFVFVDVDNYEDPGSGPGYSLFCCQEYLQKPFFFVSCDTLWENDLDWSITDNWLGVAHVSAAESSSYCNVKVNDDDYVVELHDKVYIEGSAYQAFVGLCHIKDYNIFWDALASTKLISGEHQISNGIESLIKETDTFAQAVKWTDVGDAEKYKKAVSLYENYDFSKQNEALYITNGKVIKFFVDEKITSSRVEKSKLNPEVFPPITYHSGQFYAYDFQDGLTLYQTSTPKIFQKFLEWLGKNLWKKHTVDRNIIRSTCLKFYQEKTMERLAMYNKKYDSRGDVSCINGQSIPSTKNLLASVPWESLADGVPCFMHGDLQFDNVLYDDATDKFTLLDWRQDFAGHVEFGDLYYDFAKLYGGIILNYDYIKLNLLSYSEHENEVYFDFAQRYQSNTYLSILSDYIRRGGYDLTKVRILVALIYLNMSPLHHYPFDKMLYSLGRRLLHDEILKMRKSVNHA